ncbi:tetratricopeptide repeat protein [Paenarthrobacter sp. A20]|uniref:tetratricopeptide repeat protein n=1 Tax=Paenarthrobacter sp. A20 TaxID=2817891 RepID=UPI00209EFD6F|nr:tetratricopeptide repeat protein [Paenarthrobacter sp. A20]MCP1415440.1 TPR repeat protein [Paenarthrobacter sp. A20]
MADDPGEHQWTLVERAYSDWLAAAREKARGAVNLARRIARKIAETETSDGVPKNWTTDFVSEADRKWARGTVARWEKGAGAARRQPQAPKDGPVREALVETVTALVPKPPTEMEWATFRELLEAFTSERTERQERGAGQEKARALRERDEGRHQFLAAWPVPAAQLDPLSLGLGSWAFAGALPPYVPRTADTDLAARLQRPGVTVVVGPPKSGKSRSIFQILQRVLPSGLVWWANPTPTVLPELVGAAQATCRLDAGPAERPEAVVLDDAGLIGTDPIEGLTAQRLNDLTATGAHIFVVLHDQVLAEWEHQLTHRLPVDKTSASGLGVTRELMDLLNHRVRYAPVLDDTETATHAYDGADERLKSFDLARLAEAFAGVQALRERAQRFLSDPTGLEAALLEAAIDATIAFPTGTTIDILCILTQAHYHRRQPNRPWRPHRLDQAIDALTTGITESSPHAILTTTDHTSYRLFDALIPELLKPDRDTDGLQKTLKQGIMVEAGIVTALYQIGRWHDSNRQYGRAREVLTDAAEHGSDLAMLGLGHLVGGSGDLKGQRTWWERAADAGNSYAMYNLGLLAHDVGDKKGARTWWEPAVDAGNSVAMLSLGALFYEAGERERARILWESAAKHGQPVALLGLGNLARDDGDVERARTLWERAAEAGEADAMFSLGLLADKAGDTERACTLWEQAAEAGNTDALLNLGATAYLAGDRERARTLWDEAVADGKETVLLDAADAGEADVMFHIGLMADKAGNTERACTLWEQAAEAGNTDALLNLGATAYLAGDRERARTLWERAAEAGSESAMLGVLAHDDGDLERARTLWEGGVEAGDPDAMYHLGVLAHDSGDLERARTLWEQAAEAGDTYAMYELGFLARGDGDLERARTLWEQAAEAGDTYAMYELGYLVRDDGDLERARTLWKRAAEAGDTDSKPQMAYDAMLQLACLEESRGDLAEAERWRLLSREPRV